MKAAAASLVLLLALSGAAPADRPEKDTRPKLSLKANPSMAFSPARVVVTADVSGGANDDPEFYCPAVEWEWGDGTRSNQSADCDPYEPGKTEIKRHFTADRVYRTQGEYRIQFRLKKKGRVIAAASTTIKIRPGLGDPGGGS